jgi:spoIIIJ-associated protein
MLKWIETTGRTEEDAIAAALFQLGLERDDVSVEVVERAKSGFFGFGSNPAKVRVSYEEENGVPTPRNDLTAEEVIAAAREQAPKPAPKPVEKPKAPEQKPEEKKADKPAAPAASAAPAAAPAPAAEETILAAKPGQQPPRPRQPRRDAPKRVPRSAERLQEGDEVIMQAAPTRAPVEQVPLTLAEPTDEKANQIKTFLVGLMAHMEVEATPEVYTSGDAAYKVILQGKNLGAIIGRRGETLDAIQQLTNYALNHGQPKRVRVHVDAEGYRSKREESLQHLAQKVAGKVVRYRKNMTLEPMNAYERHVIHTALQDYPNVTTYSTGVEPNRRTVVAYAPGQK